MKKYISITIIFFLIIVYIFILKNESQTKDTSYYVTKNPIIERKKILEVKKTKLEELNRTVLATKTLLTKIELPQQLIQNRNLDELSDTKILNLLQNNRTSLKIKKSIISLLSKRATVNSIQLLFENIENMYDEELLKHIQNSVVELADNIVSLGKEEEMGFLLTDAYMQYKDDDRFNQSLITAISKMENDDVLLLLEKEFMNDETSRDVKITILDSMQNLQNEEYVSQLITKLIPDNKELILLSTKALASIANEDAVTALLNWSSDFEDEDNTDIVGETFQVLVKRHPKLKEDILDELEIYNFDSDSVKDDILNILE